MMKLSVVNTDMEPLRDIEVPEDIFDRPYRRDILYDAVRQYRANQRQGTHSTKRRDEVAGSSKKLWKQKHTGRARMGDAKSPLWRHGGVVFGPKPRDYSYSVPRKVRLAAYKSLLSERFRRGLLSVVEELAVPEPKTKIFAERYAKWLDRHKTILFIAEAAGKDVLLASRNIPGVKIARVDEVNVYDMARFEMVVFTEGALSRFMEVLQ